MLFEKAKILLVDDDADKRLATEAVLEQLDAEVISVDSGSKALRTLLTNHFAVILLDVNMPGMDGFEAAALIRQRKKSEHTPIIFMTAFPDDTHAIRGYSLGAVDYVLVPVVPEVLRAKVSVFVELHRMSQQAIQQAEQRVSLEHEHALRLAAEQANQAKNDFLANISHELRTPMNAIIGMTNLAIIESVKVPLAQEYLQIVNSSAQVLLDLLNEILDYSKLSTGKFTFRYSSFSLRKIIHELCATMRYHAEEKGLAFESHIDDNVHDMLWGDPLRIRQILMNLLSNSIKFTETGRVKMSVRSVLINSEESEIKFIIQDTGIGISPNDQERIFAPFAQADSSMTRRHNGTGLGLAITSDLVHAMRGKHELESAVGEGSTFTITIPLRHDINAEKITDESSPISKDVAKLQESPPNKKLKVLAVEDVRANQILLQRILEKRGHEVTVVSDGSKAVEFLKHQRADIVLMDLQMPVMDGFQACEIIKTIPAARNTRIIAITAHATDADRQACLNAGMDGYLAKPINFVDLLELVEAEVP